MIIKTHMLSAGETAFILRLALGPRQWSDFLADAIRDKTAGIGGLVLLPAARGPRRVPLYRPADVAAFIRQVRTIDPSLRPGPVASVLYQVDDTIGLPWRARRATLATSAPRMA